MNEQTEKLIRELAMKLGTTTDHLWAVLVHQARIQSISYLATILVSGAILFGLLHLLNHCFKEIPATETKRAHCLIEGDAAAMFGVIFCVLVAVWITFSLIQIPEIVTGFFNPEFYAIKQIIK